MPNCLQLTRKGETEPMGLSQIDEEICGMLDIPVHPTKYVGHWFDSIGFSLACGKTFEEIITILQSYVDEGNEPADIQMLRVAKWLKENFEVHVWAER